MESLGIKGLIFHSNYGSLLHHFRDTASYRQKVIDFPQKIIPPAFNTSINSDTVRISLRHLNLMRGNLYRMQGCHKNFMI